MSRAQEGASSGAPSPHTLSEMEARRLTKLEAEIEAGLSSFIKVGSALVDIRDNKLHRRTHKTFEAYCRERWGMSRAYANRQIAAATVANEMAPIGAIPSEAIARELVRLETEQMGEAWAESIERHGPTPTAAQVREVVNELFPKSTPTPKATDTRTDEGEKLWKDEAVLAWAKKRRKAKRTRDQIMAESREGAHGWPLPGKHLHQNAVDRVIAILEDREARPEVKTKKQPSEGHTRLRQLSAQRRSGIRTDTALFQLQREISLAVSKLEFFDLDGVNWTADNQDILMDVEEDLDRLYYWHNTIRAAVTAHTNQFYRAERGRKLRDRASDPSSAPNERMKASMAYEEWLKSNRDMLSS